MFRAQRKRIQCSGLNEGDNFLCYLDASALCIRHVIFVPSLTYINSRDGSTHASSGRARLLLQRFHSGQCDQQLGRRVRRPCPSQRAEPGHRRPPGDGNRAPRAAMGKLRPRLMSARPQSSAHSSLPLLYTDHSHPMKRVQGPNASRPRPAPALRAPRSALCTLQTACQSLTAHHNRRCPLARPHTTS